MFYKGAFMRICFLLVKAFPFLLAALIGNSTVAMEKPEGGTLTVESATDIAIRNNPGLARMRARFEAMREVPSQVGTLPDPMLSIGAMNLPTDSFDRDQEGMTQLQIGFSQVIPFPGKLGLRKEAAALEASAASFSVEEMRLKLINHVTQKWWQVFYLDRAIDTIKTNQALLRQFIEVAKTKYETGKGLQQDVLLAQLELSKLFDKEIAIKSMRDNQAIQLNTLMDRPPLTAIMLPDALPEKSNNIFDEQQLYQLAEQSRPLLQAKEQSLAAAQSRLKLAKRDYYPDFKIALNYGDRTGNNPMPMGGNRSDMVSVMLGVKMPLYARTKQSKAVNQRSSEYQRERYNLLDERSGVLANISSSLTDYRRAQEQKSLFEDGIIPQARQTVESMLAGYQVNQVDFLNLVRSQVTLFNYELQYWKALTETKQSLSSLQAAVGEVSIYE